MMAKKIVGFGIACLLSTSLFAQATTENPSFAPKAGQFQVSLVLGKGQFFEENISGYLLPDYNATSIGLPSTGSQSGLPTTYFKLGSMNSNSLLNMAGIQGRYFFTDRLDLNLMLCVNINRTPKVNYGDGDNSVEGMPIPAYKWVDGQYTFNYLLHIGSDYWFKTSNPRISPYIGVAGLGGYANISTTRPYTGEVDGDGDPIEATTASSRAGYAWQATGAITSGVDYSIASGLTLGLEVQVAAYTYSALKMQPTGYANFVTENHEFRAFQMPMLKLGFRF